MKRQHSTTPAIWALFVIFTLGTTSCKKEQNYTGPTQCFVCNDANGNELNVICAPSEDSAYRIAKQSWPDLTLEQFHTKCPNQ